MATKHLSGYKFSFKGGQGSDWSLVRRVSTKNTKWFAATDRLKGSNVYGYPKDSVKYSLLQGCTYAPRGGGGV